MSTLRAKKGHQGQRLILPGVSWQQYLQLLRTFEDRHLRLTYVRGVVELRAVSFAHECANAFLARMINTLTEELNLPVHGGGSTTFKRRKFQCGLEPDGSWWIANEARIRGKKRIDLRTDAPPDLALEIDISNSSLNRLAIYAKLGLPEIWRSNGAVLEFLLLEQGKYQAGIASKTFPGLHPGDLLPFLLMQDQTDQTTIIRQFRVWVRQSILLHSTKAPDTKPPELLCSKS